MDDGSREPLVMWTELDEAQSSSRSRDSASARGPVSLDEALLIADPEGTHGRAALAAAVLANMCGGMGGAIGPFLMEPLSHAGGYSAWEDGLHASSMFVGMWMGSFASSAADTLGPGKLMTISLVGLVGGALLQVTSPAIIVAVSSRAIVGFSLVLTYQTSNTFVVEWAEIRVRGGYIALLHVAIAVGGLVTTALAIGVLETAQLGYRALLALNALPALVSLWVLAPFVARRESPRWLLVARGASRCQRMLAGLASARGVRTAVPEIALHIQADVGGRGSASQPAQDRRSSSPALTAAGASRTPEAEAPPPQTATHLPQRGRLRLLLSMWRLHVTGALLAFALNFGSKGTEIWVGVYVAELGQPQLKRSIYFATIGGKIAGDLLSMCFIRRWGRLRCLQIGYLGAAAATLLLGVSADVSAPRLLLLGFLQGLFTDACWSTLYAYLAEIFPSTIRNTGFGLSMGLGRAGGVASSALGGLLQSSGRQTAFISFGLALALGGLVACIPRVETARRALVDSIEQRTCTS